MRNHGNSAFTIGAVALFFGASFVCGGCSGSSGSAAGSPSNGGSALTDDQIVGIVTTANAGEAAQAQLAVSVTKNQAVMDLAMMMQMAHTQLNSQLMAVSQKDSLPAANSSIEQQLASGGQQTMSMLQATTGAAFDREYVDAQVAQHQGAAQLFMTQLIPGAQNADLKAFLQSMLTVVQMHLQMSQQLQGELGDAGTTPADGG